MQPGISVIICCYNGEGKIAETLKYLAQQIVPANINWEVILVDNASTDNTIGVATAAWHKFNQTNAGFKILNEPMPGKNYAFKKGVNEARFEYLLTCDDDNRLNRDYITVGFNIMQSDNMIGVLGGCGIFDAEQPVNEEILKHKIAYVNGPQPWAEKDNWVYGAGSFCRRSLFLSFYDNGWQQVTTGRNGTKLICGEDVEICFMFFLSGYKIIADDRLLFKHFVPLKRQNINYIKQLHYWQSYSYVLLSGYLLFINKSSEPIDEFLNSLLIRNVKAAILTIINFKKKLPPDECFKRNCNLKSYMGAINAVLLNRRKIINHYKLLK
jgi:glycosyltransferase involved in cell wall biosynthesis